MCRFNFGWIAGIVPFMICISSFQGSSMKANEGLNQHLAVIRSQNKGKETNWAKLEAECLKLVKDHNSPEEKGEIYATIALIYAEKGYTSREDVRIPKALEYCKKALQHPLDATTACEMYGRWAGALMVTYWSYAEEDFVTVRQEAIVPCLTGLKLALDNKAPKEYPKAPPPVSKYDNPGDKELVNRHKEELAAQKKWQFLEKLFFQRKALTQMCISLYSHKPYDADELRNLAQKILKNHEGVVNELIGQVEARIAELEAPSTQTSKQSPREPAKDPPANSTQR